MAIMAGPKAARIDATPLSLSELKALQFEILQAFDDACRRNDLTYYLNGGTLLGAVVHGGYIPWDDDIDVIMPREDYDRFCALAATDPDLAPGHSLATARTRSDYPLPFAKFGREGTLVIDHSARDLHVPVNIDVFPLDGWAPRGRRRLVQKLRMAWHRRLIEMHLGTVPANWRAPFVVVAKFLMLFCDANQKANALERVLRRYSRRYTDHVGLLAWGVGSVVPRAEYGATLPLAFEGSPFSGPQQPEAILERCYSARFREIPPVEEQVSMHRFTAYLNTN